MSGSILYIDRLTINYSSELGASQVAQWVKNLPAMQELQEPWAQSLVQEDPLEGGLANPQQCSCLENPTDRGAWQATVHGVAKGQT